MARRLVIGLAILLALAVGSLIGSSWLFTLCPGLVG